MADKEAKNVFISFRFEDGNDYKEKLCDLFDKSIDTVDYSEDVDRSDQTEEQIKKFLYGKLKRSSITIILLTPKALSYKRNSSGEIDDWIYDEVRYSLEDRENNRTNGLIAVYTPETEKLILASRFHECSKCNGYFVTTIFDQENLFRKNMMNIKPSYKHNKCVGIYNSDYDSYCSLVSFENFKNNFPEYIKIASEKRNNIDQYDLVKKL